MYFIRLTQLATAFGSGHICALICYLKKDTFEKTTLSPQTVVYLRNKTFMSVRTCIPKPSKYTNTNKHTSNVLFHTCKKIPLREGYSLRYIFSLRLYLISCATNAPSLFSSYSEAQSRDPAIKSLVIPIQWDMYGVWPWLCVYVSNSGCMCADEYPKKI